MRDAPSATATRQCLRATDVTISNADLCREVGLHLNSLAMVDNFANGLMHEEISFEKFQVLVKANQEKVNRLFQRLFKILV